jgi:outer membrane protein OmpA-like peptidoglycan-associated protein
MTSASMKRTGRPSHRRLGLALGAVLALLPLTGCQDAGFSVEPVDLACPSQPGGPVTLAVGARANSAAPVLPPPIVDLVREAAKQSQTVSIVRVDGSPTVSFQGTFRTDAANDVARTSELDQFVRDVQNRVAALRPKAPEADVLAALGEAARITPAGGTVVLIDSGLQTTGQIRFQDPGTFGADPSEFVTYLRARSLMPALADRSVVLVGLGNTAEPQPALDAGLRARVTALWQTVVQAAGASCVEIVDTAAGRTSVDTDIPVTLVALPSVPPFQPCGETVLRDGDTVGFLPDQAVFRDPVAARVTLQDLATLVINGRQEVELIGTTATAGPSEEGRVQLSRQRAEAVKSVLVELGVPAERITTVGAGTSWPDRVPDLAPDGSLIPWAAAQNRSVIVRLSCPTTS